MVHIVEEYDGEWMGWLWNEKGKRELYIVDFG